MNTVSLTLTEICLLGAILIICAVLITPAFGQTPTTATTTAPEPIRLLYLSAGLRGVARMLERKQQTRQITTPSEEEAKMKLLEKLKTIIASPLPKPTPRAKFVVKEIGGEWWVMNTGGMRYPCSNQRQAERLAEYLNKNTKHLDSLH